MICGIDEAGRGCVGGSLFICGVAYLDELIPTLSHLKIKDSKKLSHTQREQIATELLSNPHITRHIVKDRGRGDLMDERIAFDEGLEWDEEWRLGFECRVAIIDKSTDRTFGS